ncbi:MAG TPA: RNA polymerase sigma factor [Candidatus Limnocylindrales bacterium]|nr:RNA polymerase sigma factor [Candidatus Limnocylindrales bacterium]
MDQALVERATRGDRDAYEALARASVDRLYAIAYEITRDPDRADDAVQQALVAMWRDLPSLRDPSRFEGWTYRLVSNASLQELRRRRRANVVALSPELVARQGDFVARAAARDELDRALAMLSPDHRAVLVLRHLAGLSIDELAEVLGIPRGTVASRLHHATRTMRAAIEAGDRQAIAGGAAR